MSKKVKFLKAAYYAGREYKRGEVANVKLANFQTMEAAGIVREVK